MVLNWARGTIESPANIGIAQCEFRQGFEQGFAVDVGYNSKKAKGPFEMVESVVCRCSAYSLKPSLFKQLRGGQKE